MWLKFEEKSDFVHVEYVITYITFIHIFLSCISDIAHLLFCITKKLKSAQVCMSVNTDYNRIPTVIDLEWGIRCQSAERRHVMLPKQSTDATTLTSINVLTCKHIGL